MGTIVHRSPIKIVRPINLKAFNKINHWLLEQKIIEETYIGGITPKPFLLAITPVINGSNALPVCPNPAIQPREPVSKYGGRIRTAWFAAMGYMGPRKNPTKHAAIALPTSDGTSQTMISSLPQGRIRLSQHGSRNTSHPTQHVEYRIIAYRSPI